MGATPHPVAPAPGGSAYVVPRWRIVFAAVTTVVVVIGWSFVFSPKIPVSEDVTHTVLPDLRGDREATISSTSVSGSSTAGHVFQLENHGTQPIVFTAARVSPEALFRRFDDGAWPVTVRPGEPVRFTLEAPTSIERRSTSAQARLETAAGEVVVLTVHVSPVGEDR